MREDDRLLYGKLIEAVQGEDIAISRNAAMHLIASLSWKEQPWVC
jgi:hypothetical protein